jgi:hypothetical protein
MTYAAQKELKDLVRDVSSRAFTRARARARALLAGAGPGSGNGVAHHGLKDEHKHRHRHVAVVLHCVANGGSWGRGGYTILQYGVVIKLHDRLERRL